MIHHPDSILELIYSFFNFVYSLTHDRVSRFPINRIFLMNIKYIAPDFFWTQLRYQLVSRDVLSFEASSHVFSHRQTAWYHDRQPRGGGKGEKLAARNEERGNKHEECSAITIDTLVRGWTVINRRGTERGETRQGGMGGNQAAAWKVEPDETLVDVICLSWSLVVAAE